MKKRLLSVFLTLMMLLTLVPTTALAAGAMTVDVEPPAGRTLSTLQEGDVVKVTVRLPQVAPTKKLQFDLNFDDTYFSYNGDGAAPDIIAKLSIGKVEISGSNIVRIVAAGLTAASFDAGTVAMQASFTVKAGVAGSTKTFGLSGLKIEDPSVTLPTGQVDVTIPKAPITSVTFTLADPVKGTTLPTLSGLGIGYTGAVAWYEGTGATGSAVTGNAKPGQKYTAKVTLTADTSAGESFDNSVSIPAGYTKDSSTSTKLVLTKTFPETGEKSLTKLEITGNTIGTKHHGGTIDQSELTVKATYDNGSTDDAFEDYTIVYNGGADTALKKGDNSITVEVGSVKSAALAVTGVLGQVLTAADFDFTTPNEVTYSGSSTGLTNRHNLTWGGVNRKGNDTTTREFITHYGRFSVTDAAGNPVSKPTDEGTYTIKFWWVTEATATHEALDETNAIEFTGKIKPAPLTITANDHAITYGDAPAGNGVNISGFVTGEDASVLTGTPGYDYSYTQYGDVGEYTITPKGYTAFNYAMTYKPG